jgi:hypothetical protein
MESVKRYFDEKGDNMNEHTGNGGKSGMKEAVRETTDKLREKTKEVASQARERGEDYVRQGKDRTAHRLASVSESFRHTAERFEEEHDPTIAHYTRQIADRLERAASYVRDSDVQRLRQDGEELVRNHPALFFGGLFLAGFAAARFLKASAEHHHGPEMNSGPVLDPQEYPVSVYPEATPPGWSNPSPAPVQPADPSPRI